MMSVFKMPNDIEQKNSEGNGFFLVYTYRANFKTNCSWGS